MHPSFGANFPRSLMHENPENPFCSAPPKPTPSSVAGARIWEGLRKKKGGKGLFSRLKIPAERPRLRLEAGAGFSGAELFLPPPAKLVVGKWLRRGEPGAGGWRGDGGVLGSTRPPGHGVWVPGCCWGGGDPPLLAGEGGSRGGLHPPCAWGGVGALGSWRWPRGQGWGWEQGR